MSQSLGTPQKNWRSFWRTPCLPEFSRLEAGGQAVAKQQSPGNQATCTLSGSTAAPRGWGKYKQPGKAGCSEWLATVCNPLWPQAHYPPASVSWVLGLWTFTSNAAWERALKQRTNKENYHQKFIQCFPYLDHLLISMVTIIKMYWALFQAFWDITCLINRHDFIPQLLSYLLGFTA